MSEVESFGGPQKGPQELINQGHGMSSSFVTALISTIINSYITVAALEHIRCTI